MTEQQSAAVTCQTKHKLTYNKHFILVIDMLLEKDNALLRKVSQFLQFLLHILLENRLFFFFKLD